MDRERGGTMTKEERKHTSARYEQELREIKEKLIYLGALTEKAIEKSIQSLLERDSDLARSVITEDDQIDLLDVEIEEKCISLLALRQPAARDLRFITQINRSYPGGNVKRRISGFPPNNQSFGIIADLRFQTRRARTISKLLA